jgi:hypothetical protein
LKETFWRSFPSNNIPDALADLIQDNRKNLLTSKFKRAIKCLDYLVSGALAFQSKELGPCSI